ALPGPVVIAISGATVSTVHDAVAGDGSSCPAASVARTANVCGPCARPVSAAGEVHAVSGAPSRLQPNVEPGSLDVDDRLAVAIGSVPLGPAVIAVSGGVRSTVQLRVAGVGSTLPTASLTRTAKLCAASRSPL